MYYYYIFVLHRQEAKECPKVVVADIDTTAFSDRQTVKYREVSSLHWCNTRHTQ